MTSLLKHAERITSFGYSDEVFVESLIAQMDIHDRNNDGSWKDVCRAAIAYSKRWHPVSDEPPLNKLITITDSASPMG